MGCPGKDGQAVRHRVIATTSTANVANRCSRAHPRGCLDVTDVMLAKRVKNRVGAAKQPIHGKPDRLDLRDLTS
jgi:hypothetical protein